jgi:hypothetical protein
MEKVANAVTIMTPYVLSALVLRVAESRGRATHPGWERILVGA